MEDFSTILWILVIAAASLLSQGRKARSGKTSRKPGPATDDTAPHPTPTTRPEWARNPRISEDSGFPGRQDARRRNPESRGGKRSGGSGTPRRLRPGKPRKAFLQAENDRKSPRHGSARTQRNNCFSGRCGLSAEAAGRECPKAASRGTATDSNRTARPGDGLRTSGDRAHGLCNDHAGFDRFGRQPVRREPDGRGAGGRNSRGFRSAQGRDLRRDTQTEIRRITVRTTPTRARGNAQTARYPSPTDPNRAWKYANIPDETGTGKG